MSSAAGLVHAYADLGEVKLHYVVAGRGFPVVLLHGWPHTWYAWRHVIARLADRYMLIAPDLRGLGDSSRPMDGYDKKTMAGDIWRLVAETLGHKRFFLVGHDWGGPTAFALAAAHPEAVLRLAILDVVIPGDGGDFSQGGRRWHHGFHATPDLPEALTQGRERLYLSWFYQTFSARPDAITEADIDEYLRTYTQPGAMRAGFGLYRALARDAEDNRERIASGGKLPMPVLAVGGAVGRGRGAEPEESLRRVAKNVRGVVVPDCGHMIPEEKPAVVAQLLSEFFAEQGGVS